MLASIIIEYSVKSLNKVFDYKIPDNLKNIIKVGHKVIVPFAFKDVEGFVLKIHDNIDSSLEYREIISIPDPEFYLNDELLKLGKYLSDSLLCNLISCYQIMLPKALKASIKTNINKKYISKIKLNDEVNIEEYKLLHKNAKKEIEIIDSLNSGEVLKSSIKSTVVNNLIKKGIIIETKYEVNREVYVNEEEKKDIKLTLHQENAVKEIINSSDNNFLLYGVTGSGKTEVYIELIKRYLDIGKTSIVLVPEISLTPQIVSRFKSVFGDKIAVFHSSLSEGEKYDEYRKIMNK